MRNKRKKISVMFGLFFACFVLIFIVISVVERINYRKTYEFKLKELGYSEATAAYFEEFFEEKYLEYILDMEKNENIENLSKDPYFIIEKLQDYLDYIDESEKTDIREIVSIINVGADKDFYTDIKPTNTSIDDPYLVLVNKFHQLPSDYEPAKTETISLMYAYEGRLIDSSIYGEFISMWSAAKSDGLSLIVVSGFRDFGTQEKIYNNFLASRGRAETDRISARPGHSEHQLGFALDLVAPNYGLVEDFDKSDEFAWLSDNAHKHGFILRYPKDSEHLTGYSYEPWHYRYVGVEVATYIHENDITFDEYYAYYIAK